MNHVFVYTFSDIVALFFVAVLVIFVLAIGVAWLADAIKNKVKALFGGGK